MIEPQRHNAAGAAHKDEHKYINSPLCVLCAFVVQFFSCLSKPILAQFLGEE